MEYQEKSRAGRLILLCAFIYFVSYITRSNYSAIIAEMVSSLDQPKSALGAALTGSFITYGAGQLVSGYCSDRIQPKWLIAGGLAVTVGMNCVLPLCGTSGQMTAVWCVNGFAQAFMWPPLIKMMAAQLSVQAYRDGCVRVSWGSSLGTMVIYLTAPLLIGLLGWKGVFWASALVGAVGLVLWCRFCPRISLQASGKIRTNAASGKRPMLTGILVIALLAIMVQGLLREGVGAWMPSYVAEVCGLSNTSAILAGVLLPLFAIVCHHFAGVLCSGRTGNLFLWSGVIFGVGLAAAALLYLLGDSGKAFSAVLLALLAGCMHGVNLLLIGMLPPYFARGGNVGMISGVINSAAYLGSALSAYLIPAVTENAGWDVTVLLWLAFAAAGTVLCAVCIPAWKKLK